LWLKQPSQEEGMIGQFHSPSLAMDSARAHAQAHCLKLPLIFFVDTVIAAALLAVIDTSAN
jgi:hypothetical protein